MLKIAGQPIDFEVKRSKVKVTMHKLLKMVSGT